MLVFAAVWSEVVMSLQLLNFLPRQQLRHFLQEEISITRFLAWFRHFSINFDAVSPKALILNWIHYDLDQKRCILKKKRSGFHEAI
jgi:hypothetical protein